MRAMGSSKGTHKGRPKGRPYVRSIFVGATLVVALLWSSPLKRAEVSGAALPRQFII